jgi:tRNA pseudouridine55 synthase
VRVTVTHLSPSSYENGRARIRVRASAGFYVRSLAHDLGQHLGCGAHLETLRRLRAGAFGEESATPLEAIEAEGAVAARLIVPIAQLLPQVPAVILTESGVRRAMHGNELRAEDLIDPSLVPSPPAQDPFDGRWRLLNGDGTLLGIAELRPGGLLHPVIVLV